MTVAELYAFLEQRISRALSAEWDNDGLACCPAPDREVRRVLIALDASDTAVTRAVEGGFDVLLTHHPLLFRGVKELTPAHTVPRKLLALARADVAAMSFHTRLDAAKGGVNDTLATLVGLSDTAPFAPEGEIPCGRIGRFDPPMRADAFAQRVCEVLRTPALTLSGDGKRTISPVAVLGGEGGDFAEAALDAGADLFLAGRIGYHRAADAAEEGLVLIEAGHYATEFPVCEGLAALLYEADADIAVEVLDAPTVQTISHTGGF